MKILMIVTLTLLTQAYANVFTPADPASAPAGLVYDVARPPVENPQLFAGKRVAILAAHGVQESELTYPYHYLKNRGATVDILIPSWSAGKVLAVKYLRPTLWIKGSYTFAEAQENDYHLLILTGGAWNTTVVRKDESALELIRQQERQGGLIAAVCAGGQILINAEMAAGLTMTASPSVKEDLINAGANYLDRPAVIDGNVITGRGPAEMLEFMQAIHTKLARP